MKWNTTEHEIGHECEGSPAGGGIAASDDRGEEEDEASGDRGGEFILSISF
jgi:hypothetical protein